MPNRLRSIAYTSILSGSLLFTNAACGSAENTEGQQFRPSPEQTARITEAFRLDRMGILAFDEAGKPAQKTKAVCETVTTRTSNFDTFPGGNIPLGQSVVANVNISGHEGTSDSKMTITPSADSRHSHLTYQGNFRTMDTTTNDALRLINPHEKFFSADGNDAASPDEIRAFYRDPDTSVEQASYDMSDTENGTKSLQAAHKYGKLIIEVDIRDHTGQSKLVDWHSPDADPALIIQDAFLIDTD